MKIINCFFWGAVAASFALVIEIAISAIVPEKYDVQTVIFSISFFSVILILVEEITKFAVMFKLILKKDLKASIFLKSFFFGLGFSFFEIFLNLSKFGFSSIGYSLLSFLSGIFLFHMLTSCYIGYFIAISRNFRKVIFAPIVAFMAFLHLAYNLAIIHNIPFFIIYSLLFILIVMLFVRYIALDLAKYEN